MAIRTAQVEIVQQMLKSGTKVTAVVEPVSCLSFAMQQYLCRLHLCNMYHLHDALPAVHQSVVQALLYILMLHSPHPHQYKYKPRRLLHQAAIWNNVAMTALLLANNADNNARDFSVSCVQA